VASKLVISTSSVTVFTTTSYTVTEVYTMFKRTYSKLVFCGLLVVSALVIPGCQSASGGKPEWLTGSEGTYQSSDSGRFDPLNYAATLKNPARTKALQTH
jgi:hypothetical protein